MVGLRHKIRINLMGNYPAGAKLGFHRPQAAKARESTNYDGSHPDTGEVFPDMTRQSEMAGCDIHNILKQFSQRGFEDLVRQNAALGQYADLTDLPEYQDALNIVHAADASFAALPSQVRDRFHNDPMRFIEFLQDPRNQDEAVRLGLATKRPEPEPPPKTSTGELKLDD
ncbi:internal scaffolding protein [Blackfly microvirus SF02]|uniref:Internal scaffolding protein n=1 Tax=Blackfly microvirus SF02 TaxID=2576452 RepID=A0A4P8PKG1_9VIRU|nr:internal scaffolding protein [Blackfly microvirus SF02]